MKISIDATGVYRLTGADLAAAGLDLASVDARRLQLTQRGQPVAMLVAGEADGRLDSADELIFYAVGIAKDDPNAVYSERNVYWLTAAVTPGLRMAMRAGAPTREDAPQADFPARLHAEEDTAYWQAMPAEHPGDRWFWGGRLSPRTVGLESRRTYSVTLTQPAASALDATLRVAFKGFTQGDHRTRLLVNGTPADDQEWSGQVRFVQESRVDHVLLREGVNIVTVESLDSGAAVDQLLVDWIEIDYRARFVAQAETLAFTVPGGGAIVEATGFQHTETLLLDVTRPEAPIVVEHASFSPADASVGIRFQSDEPAAYLALTRAALRTPAALRGVSLSDWRSPEHAADYIIITHRDFQTDIERLADHRRSQGLRVVIAPVDALYDEFNHGIFNPSALRAFLAHAYEHWEPPAPRYALLVGDAYQDYRNLLYPPESGLRNWTPSQLVRTALLGETSSDTWFGNVDPSDPAPELAVGRLPVRSRDELTDLVDRLIAYDQDDGDRATSDLAVLIADDDDSSFALATRHIAARLPEPVTTRFIDAAVFPPGDPSVAILEAWREDALLTHYSGHGDVTQWGDWEDGVLLAVDDITELGADASPILTTMANCLSNFFVGPALSMGEALINRQEANTLAVWGPTGLGTPTAHRSLMDAFYKAIAQGNLTLGEATLAAFAVAPADDPAFADLTATYTLLGDPATRLRLPPRRRQTLLPIVRGPP